MLYNLFENRDFVSVFAVALLAEGVDRNLLADDGVLLGDVALLAEAIEANLETDADGAPSPASGRYPQPYGSSFWIRKAIRWALRQHARTDPQWVLDFIAAHHDRLSGLSRREALKHL